MSQYFVAFKDVLPIEMPAPVTALFGEETLANVGISAYVTDSWTDFFMVRAQVGFDPASESEWVIAFPAFPDLGLVVRTIGELELFIDNDEFRFQVSAGEFSVRLPNQFLKPVRKDSDGQWIDDPQRDFAEVEFSYGQLLDGFPSALTSAPFVFTANHLVELEFQYPFQNDQENLIVPFASLNGPAMVGETGAVLNIEDIAFNFDPDDPVLFVRSAFLDLPDDLTGDLVLPRLELANATLRQSGFSGTVSAVWPLHFQDGRFIYQLDDGTAPEAKLFGINGGLRTIATSIADNQLTSGIFAGGLVIPYFDEPIDVQLELQNTGDFKVTLTGLDEDGVNLRKEDLIDLNVRRLEVAKTDNRLTFTVSGGLEPLLFASDGLEWPRLDIEDLTIDQNLADLSEPPILRFREAWVDLKELATLDLFGFHFELNRVGVGYQESDDKLWIDLTGNIKLIDQIPIGVGVEGFRITWPRLLYEQLGLDELLRENPEYSLSVQDAINIARQIEVKFDGVYLFFGVPQAVEFEGYIRFIKEAQKIGFAGDVVLRLPTTGLEIEAGLMIGINLAQPSPYPFLYIYFGILLPSGIPLGQSGLALKGAKGLFGLNVTPAKTPEQNWYFDWYKRGPIEGAHPTNKWEDLQWALALGAGVTITTTDGKILGIQGLLILAVPGPFIIIEGKALIFDGVFPGEPPLKALGVLDGRERTIQLNIEAGAELIEDVLEANGVAEAFFDFKDLTNWHLYLGQDEPQDRRVHALILKLAGSYLFRADAYLMTDMIQPYTVRSRLGVFIGFQPPIPALGPVNVTIDAVISGSGELQIRAGNLIESSVEAATSGEALTGSDIASEVLDNVNFSGNLGLDATLEITAFGFGLRASASANMMCEGPKPFEVKGKLSVQIEVPLPLSTAETIPVVGDFFEFIDEAVELPEVEPIDIDIEFTFRPEDFTVPDVASPVLRQQSVESHFFQAAHEVHATAEIASPNQAVTLATESPIVSIDHRPVLQFQNDMNVDASVQSPIAGHPDGVKTFHQGMVTMTPSVTRVVLYAHDKQDGWHETNNDEPSFNLDAPMLNPNWEKIADSAVSSVTENDNVLPMFGVWRSDASPDEPERVPTRILRLWSVFPFSPGIGTSYYQEIFGHENQVSANLISHPDWFVGKEEKVKTHCVRFKHLHESTRKRGARQASKRSHLPVENPLELNDVRFTGEHGLHVPSEDDRPCLYSEGSLWIDFPSHVRWAEFKFCGKIPAVVIAEAPVFRPRKKGETTGRENVTTYRQIPVDRQSKQPQSLILQSEVGFKRVLFARSTTQLCQVCFRNEQEVRDEASARDQSNRNNDLFQPSIIGARPILKPGRHYRMVVQTKVAIQPNLDRNPFPEGTFLHEHTNRLASEIVETILNAPSGTKSFTDEIYFQTAGPPHSLNRLIKWTTPERLERRHERLGDFLIRFKRPYLHKMFQEAVFPIRAFVRSTEGDLFDQWDLRWAKAQSATLTPDEQAWLMHLEEIGNYEDVSDAVPTDDILRIQPKQITDMSIETGLEWDVVNLTSEGKWLRAVDDSFGSPRQVLRQSTAASTLAIARGSGCREFRFSTLLSGRGSGQTGVVFRYVDKNNFYRFLIDLESKHQRLEKVVQGESRLLMESQRDVSIRDPIRLSIVSRFDPPMRSSFEIQLGAEIFGTVVDVDPRLESGDVGFASWGCKRAQFSSAQLTQPELLSPQTRYELVLTGGNGGRQLFGDRFVPSSVESTFGAEGWSLASQPQNDSAWQLDPQRALLIQSISGGLPLIMQHSLPNCDLRARLFQFAEASEVGFILRHQTIDNVDYQYRVTLSNMDGLWNLCVRLWSSSGTQIDLCDQEVPTPSLTENVELRANLFGNRIRVYLDQVEIKSVTLDESSLSSSMSGFRYLVGGSPGIHATAGVGFRDLEIRDAELISIPFMSSRFTTFEELIQQGKESSPINIEPGQLSFDQIQNTETKQTLFVESSRHKLRAQFDFGDGTIDRPSLEAIQQQWIDAKAALDAAFVETCQNLTGRFYAPLGERLEFQQIRSTAGVIGIYLRSPEPLQIENRIGPGPQSLNLSQPIWSEIGSTRIELYHLLEEQELDCRVLYNGDQNQALLILDSAIQGQSELPLGSYSIRFFHTRNHQDCERLEDHRYDRPFRSTLGDDTPSLVQLRFEVD